MIRRAHVADVPSMARIINDAAEFGLMLPRSLAALYENLRDFQVAVDEQGQVIGTAALTIIWANLAELASLAVDANHRGKGLGKQLARACLEEARAQGIKRVMTLTYEQPFFEKLGFHVVDRQTLPLKVWRECVRCPKNQACDEIAMIIEFDDVTEVQAPRPETPPADEYVIPVTLTARGRRPTPPPVEGD
jgi:amino-acid N-acetyltransferase